MPNRRSSSPDPHRGQVSTESVAPTCRVPKNYPQRIRLWRVSRMQSPSAGPALCRRSGRVSFQPYGAATEPWATLRRHSHGPEIPEHSANPCLVVGAAGSNPWLRTRTGDVVRQARSTQRLPAPVLSTTRSQRSVPWATPSSAGPGDLEPPPNRSLQRPDEVSTWACRGSSAPAVARLLPSQPSADAPLCRWCHLAQAPVTTSDPGVARHEHGTTLS